MSGRGGIARGPGPRSMEALRWLARVDVAGVEALGVALGFSRSVTYSHVARLEEAGLLVRAFAHGGSVVAITASGRRAVGADRAKLRAGATHGMGLRHARAISWVAALLTLRDRDWVSERAMRACDEWTVPVLWAAHRRAHRPSLGIVMRRGGMVAVEVELSHKSPRRFDAIMAGYELSIARGIIGGGLIYVSDRADVLAAVTRAALRSGVPESRFRARALDDVIQEARRGTSPAWPRPVTSERARGLG